MFANPHQLNHSGGRIFSAQSIHHTYSSNTLFFSFSSRCWKGWDQQDWDFLGYRAKEGNHRLRSEKALVIAYGAVGWERITAARWQGSWPGFSTLEAQEGHQRCACKKCVLQCSLVVEKVQCCLRTTGAPLLPIHAFSHGKRQTEVSWSKLALF